MLAALLGCGACRATWPQPLSAALDPADHFPPPSPTAAPDRQALSDGALTATSPEAGPDPTVRRLPPCDMPVSQRLREEAWDLWNDYGNYYSRPVLWELAAGIGTAAVFANTPLDQEFQDWYQNEVRSEPLDGFASFVKPFGNGMYAVPACVGLGLIGALRDDTRWGSTLADFGGRTGRAFAVGGPPLLFMQYAAGSSRPGETSAGSHWKPLDDTHGAAGHGFIGAVPFITGANMTDDPYLKACLYFCSTLPAWSRINDDMHYLSQSALGWWIAYTACEAVNRTQRNNDRVIVTPIATPEMVGIGVMYQR